ncbi:hypothetical protein MTO96_034423 [Rhipicephalus appendiculatus]
MAKLSSFRIVVFLAAFACLLSVMQNDGQSCAHAVRVMPPGAHKGIVIPPRAPGAGGRPGSQRPGGKPPRQG